MLLTQINNSREELFQVFAFEQVDLIFVCHFRVPHVHYSSFEAVGAEILGDIDQFSQTSHIKPIFHRHTRHIILQHVVSKPFIATLFLRRQNELHVREYLIFVDEHRILVLLELLLLSDKHALLLPRLLHYIWNSFKGVILFGENLWLLIGREALFVFR